MVFSSYTTTTQDKIYIPEKKNIRLQGHVINLKQKNEHEVTKIKAKSNKKYVIIWVCLCYDIKSMGITYDDSDLRGLCVLS